MMNNTNATTVMSVSAPASAKDEAKLALGKDFSKAVIFWKNLRGIKRMKSSEYVEMVESFNLLKSLLNQEEVAISLNEVATKLADLYAVNIDSFSDDEKASFIQSTLAEFNLSVFTERLHKETLELIKFHIQDLSFEEKIEFDSRRVYDPANASIIPSKGIPALKTAEDGISRTLQEMGISTMSIMMSWTSSDKDEQARLDGLKKRLLTEGFYDIATGRHYYPAFQSPSANRKATITFVEVTGTTHEECVNQITSLWCKVTGFDNFESFKSALADKEGKAVMAKVVARTATRGSNSLSMAKISPEMDTKIKSLNVKYVDDTETAVYKTYRTFDTATGVSELHENEAREITDGDGQGLGSYNFFAMVACGMRLISKNEYDFFTENWEVVSKDIHNIKPGSKLDKIIRKIPAVLQIRHGEKKGLIVRWNLEAIKETSSIDVIIPTSVRKFIGGEWADYTLEVCNYLKPKAKKFAYLNPQFISALDWENPNALIEIVRHWENYQVESIHDTAKAMEFHGMLQSSADDNDSADRNSILVEAMRTNSSLVNDYQVLNWRKDQYRKFNDDMSIGRIMLPGQYTYMVFDPAYLLNKWFGLELHHLASKTFYYNDKECEAGLFRSPMIAPFEAQKVQLVSDEEYKYLQNCVVFNGYDATADDMGGGDHDGDQCLIVTSDNQFGKIVIDGIRNCDFVVWEPAKKAQKTELTWDNFINYLAENGSVTDRTGPITNYGTKALDIANHMKGLIYFAKLLGAETITFAHPKSYGKGLGYNAEPAIAMVNNHKTFVAKALIEAKFTKEARAFYAGKDFKPADVEPWQVYFPYDFGNARGMVGEYTFEDIEKEIEYYMNIVHVVRLLQGEEIDGAKTGFHPEIADFVKIACTPAHMLNRQNVLGRDQSTSAKLNVYVSLSPLGRVHTYTESRVKVALGLNKDKDGEFNGQLNNGSEKSWILKDYMTATEEENLNKQWLMSDGTYMTIVDMLSVRKDRYNRAIYNYSSANSEDDKVESIAILKETERNELIALANTLGVSIETVAIGAYLATYTKNSNAGKGLSYAWILAGELLSVFSRGNKRYISLRMPANTETAFIKDGILYVNDKANMRIKAHDGEVAMHCINGTIFGMIHMESMEIAPKKNVVPSKAVYTLTAVGMRFYNNDVESWKAKVKANGYKFDIVMDSTDRPVITVNGEVLGSFTHEDGSLYELKGHTVKMVNNSEYCPNSPIVTKASSIANIKVMIAD